MMKKNGCISYQSGKYEKFKGEENGLLTICFIIFIIPLIVMSGIITGKRKNNLDVLGTMLFIKGIFYVYLAIATAVNYFQTETADSYTIGFTIALAIIEGGTAINDGIIKILEGAKRKFDCDDRNSKNNE